MYKVLIYQNYYPYKNKFVSYTENPEKKFAELLIERGVLKEEIIEQAHDFEIDVKNYNMYMYALFYDKESAIKYKLTHF